MVNFSNKDDTPRFQRAVFHDPEDHAGHLEALREDIKVYLTKVLLAADYPRLENVSDSVVDGCHSLQIGKMRQEFFSKLKDKVSFLILLICALTCLQLCSPPKRKGKSMVVSSAQACFSEPANFGIPLIHLKTEWEDLPAGLVAAFHRSALRHDCFTRLMDPQQPVPTVENTPICAALGKKIMGKDGAMAKKLLAMQQSLRNEE
jgi:hypothetical protein